MPRKRLEPTEARTMRRHNNKLVMLAAFAVWLLSPFAIAQDDASTDSTITVDAQPLATALKDFSDQTGLQLAYVATLAENKGSNGVENAATPVDALDAILDDTGLEYQFVNDETIAIGAAADRRGSSDSKNLSPTPVLMAQVAKGQVKTTASSQSEENEVNVVAGKVTDARTGANLKGAKVTIEETGQWTSTNNLGEFRFTNVPNDDFTLTVSFLGYAELAERVDASRERQAVSIQMESLIDEIVVLGTKSARMQALNRERTAQNSQTVISADQLGNFNGATISEALRRAPGIAFIQDPQTGEGAQVIVRGLEPDLNQVTLNGVRLVDGTGIGRSPDLSSILTESIESVTISNTLLPSQDSNGAGALIEIETKSPLDRPRRFASLAAEYGDVDGDFGEEFELGGTVSGTFGANNDFGASLSVSYRERERTSISYTTGTRYSLGQYLPADAGGEAIRDIDLVDPRRTFPFESGVDEVYIRDGIFVNEGRVASEALSLTASFEKQFSSHTNLRFDIAHNERDEENYQSSVQVDTTAGLALVPIDELGGEERWAFVSEDRFRGDPVSEERNGSGIQGLIGREINYSPENSSANTTLSFRGQTNFENWDFDYALGYSRSQTDAGRQYEFVLETTEVGRTGTRQNRILATRDFLLPEALSNTTSDGRIISVFAPLQPSDDSFVAPLFNQAGFGFYNNLDVLNASRIDFREPGDNGLGETKSASFSARRDFDGTGLKYLKAGFDFRGDTFEAPGNNVFFGENRATYVFADDIVLSDLGLVFGPGILTRVGVNDNFDVVTRPSFESFVSDLGSLLASDVFGDVTITPADRNRQLDTHETAFAGYAEGEYNIGKLQVIGGFRFEQIEVESTSFLGPEIFFFPATPETDARKAEIEASGEFITETVTQTEVMPRVLLNYQFTPNMILRGSYFETVSRPQINNLTQFRQVSLFPGFFTFPATLIVRNGNPDLEPARTQNFDIRFERYGDNVSVFKASVFFKQIENPLRLNQEVGTTDILPEDLTLPPFPEFNENLPENTQVTLTTPFNGDDDDQIWGFDLSVERALSFLPRQFEGLGVFANYTYTESEATRLINVDTSIDPSGQVEIETPLDGSPEHQGTIGLTYRNFGVDGSLLYTAQSRRFGAFSEFGLSSYAEAFETLDLQLTYTREIHGKYVRFFLRGNDLLRSYDEASLQTSIGGEGGVPKYFTGATYLGGRTFVIGTSATF